MATANVLLKRMLFRYQGHISAALVLGGVDHTGAYIYCIHPHGSTDKLPYATMGSGSLAAMSVFEARWRPDMSEEEGKKLVRDSIAGGVFNDLGSGSNIDLCVIRRGSTDYLRGYEYANEKGLRSVSVCRWSVNVSNLNVIYIILFVYIHIAELRFSQGQHSRPEDERSRSDRGRDSTSAARKRCTHGVSLSGVIMFHF